MVDDVDPLAAQDVGEAVVTQVAVEEGRSGRHVLTPPGDQTVEHQDAVAVGEESLREMRTDETGSAGD